MANAAPEPQEFGKYQILDRIAAGGMAEIFKARLDGIGGFHRTIAIKRILPHLSANPEFVDMLVDEAKIAGLLSHANIVQILDLGAIDGHYYIAMEYVDGRDLGKLLDRCIQKGITLPVPHAVYVLLEILKGLEYAHNRTVQRGGRPTPLNIVHRDITPGNVLVSFQGEVKLTDFGIAKASVKALETMSGVIKGRFDYMSPEQASGAVADPRSDLFSASILLYQLLCGRHPFRQSGELQTIEAIRRGEFTPPSEVNPDIPPALDEAVARGLAVDPDERFQSATQFKEALDRFFQDSGFIFSASTLGAFVRGLFPESDPRAARQLPARNTLRPLSSDGPQESIHDVGTILRSHDHAQGDMRAGFGDESTIIRPGPTAMSPPSAWAEAETVIRPEAGRMEEAAPNAPTLPLPVPAADPGAETIQRPSRAESIAAAHLAGAPPPPPPTARGRNDAPTVELSQLTRDLPIGLSPEEAAARISPPAGVPAASGYLRPTAAAPQPPRRPGVVYRTPSHVHVIYVVVAFAALALGLLVGVLLGSARSGPNDPVVVRGDPVLEVHFPENARLTVAGRPVPGASPVTTRVPPNKATTVRVAIPGHPTIETQVNLDYNQMRVLAFTPVDVEPSASP